MKRKLEEIQKFRQKKEKKIGTKKVQTLDLKYYLAMTL